MRCAILVLVLLAAGWCSGLAAQVEGTVRSDKGEPLAGAMVKAVDADGGVLAYAIADGGGHYVLQVEPLPEPLRLVFSCMGYEMLERTVDDPALPVDVRLREKVFELKEVVVRVPPIRALGDTLLYDVASFRRRAGNLLGLFYRAVPGRSENAGRVGERGRLVIIFDIALKRAGRLVHSRKQKCSDRYYQHYRKELSDRGTDIAHKLS